ncbi:acetamidase/formamidase family protein [Nocardioides sp.]|uniref:acetamidase/formamidase family protein n=1 Tax=Nocardioides sp. TaxID=35761 RepID=UPI0025E1745F|nr:acetamidase/formamidase family protein [Nocardioides sp.]
MERLEATQENLTVGYFERGMKPAMEIESGDVVDIETATHWGGRVTPETTLEDVMRLRTVEFPGVGPHTLTGPIRVRGAKVGSVLKVDILELDVIDFGFNLNFPGEMGTGLLPDFVQEGALRMFAHDLERMETTLGDRVRMPLQPFLGIMGVAPESTERITTVPPGSHGGNIDLRELVAGTTLYLPVWEEGAQFFIGDAHSRQGNGEVCLTAIETAMKSAKLRLTVLDDLRLDGPMAETPDAWISMGLHADLLEASRQAVRNMIELLGREYGLGTTDAYGLCSMMGDLAVTQVVNVTRGAHMSMPKSVFG